MNEDHHHHHRVDINPLFVGLVGIMAGATIVAIFHCVVIGWCGNHSPPRTPVTLQAPRRIIRTNNINGNNIQENTRSINITNTSTSTSIENSAVHLLPVRNYTGEFKEGVCAVCLSEFSEGDEVRILSECAHLFHVPCIDMWLYSHSNCPLCRAETAVPPHLHRVSPPQFHVTVMLPDSGVGHLEIV